jgi:hypothetical protein
MKEEIKKLQKDMENLLYIRAKGLNDLTEDEQEIIESFLKEFDEELTLESEDFVSVKKIDDFFEVQIKVENKGKKELQEWWVGTEDDLIDYYYENNAFEWGYLNSKFLADNILEQNQLEKPLKILKDQENFEVIRLLVEELGPICKINLKEKFKYNIVGIDGLEHTLGGYGETEDTFDLNDIRYTYFRMN